MKGIKEYSLQSRGMISIEGMPHFDKDVEFGLQVGIDGRVWICVNGAAFLRFKPIIQKPSFDAHDALRETFHIWNWLVDNPKELKASAPNAADYANSYSCPCCYYVKRMADIDISEGMDKEACEALCPMWEAWGNAFCENGFTSPFRQWNVTPSWHEYDKQFFALLIAEWAEHLLIQDGGAL